MPARVLVRFEDKIVAADLVPGHTLPENRIFHAMWSRCTNPKQISYPRYGAKGIKVCTRWKSFANFYEDMGPRPSMKHSIDRKDTRGNYEPGNCRWATAAEQAHNRDNAVYVEFEGKQQRLYKLAAQFGLKSAVLYGRLKMGWPLEEALNTPVGRKGPRPKSS